jgi:hypothetical protein
VQAAGNDFEGPVLNDGLRLQASVMAMKEEGEVEQHLQALLDAATKKLASVIPSRSASDMVALLALQGCGPQRPHADYTRESLEGIRDDGVCGGLPLGVVVALEPNTYFDVWPGAVNWDDSRFCEHEGLTLGVGDAVVFFWEMLFMRGRLLSRRTSACTAIWTVPTLLVSWSWLRDS